MQRLTDFRVLDPACGSGNFLYLALHALKDIEHRAALEAETLGLPLGFAGFHTGPHNVMGIELNSYAAELARVTVWIGELQWMLRHGMSLSKNPILKPLDHIACRDALLAPSPSQRERAERGGNWDGGVTVETQWPTVDAIIGNPPFLGDKKMRAELGDDYTEALRACYEDRVPGGADLVTYWFEKARAQIEAGKCQRAGLVATNSIRQKRNRPVLERILESGQIFNAWSDEEWVNEGATVRVSLVCFGNIEGATLDGNIVAAIHADLTAGEGLNLTQAKPLEENAGVAFQGPVKVGSFDIPGELARQWLKQPNPNSRPNNDVLRPWANGQDIAARPSDTWIIDFGVDRTEQEAALYEIPFVHVLREVKPMRDVGNREGRKKYWWRHGETVPALRAALAPLARYIATPRVAKYRMFVWLDVSVLPDSRLYAIAREDDTTFGILSSRIHEVWALANASMHGIGNDPTYNAKSCFETFPFPKGLTPKDTAPPTPSSSPLSGGEQSGGGSSPDKGRPGGVIATAAQRLNQLRENWLNPPEWTDWLRTPEEEKAGYPLRPVAKVEGDVGRDSSRLVGLKSDLQKRTLTNLYNARPAWLDNAHKTLDAAVAKAYGWNDYTPEMPDEEILRRLLALNQARSKPQ